jgi:predicted alpha/beta-hydrolase family hydrolase
MEWRVPVGDEETSAIHEPAEHGKALFVCAHGAGGHMADRAMGRVSEAMRRAGLDVVRFNFLYRQKGLHRPDPMPVLEKTFAAVVAHARSALGPRKVVIGGRSMGGRAASMIAAKGFACDGLLLLAYPLHPAGRTEKLRDAHLKAIDVPVLCFNGTRDALCDRDLMERALQDLSWQMHWLEGADHSFRLLKLAGRSEDDVYAELAELTRGWLSRLG